MNDDETTAVRQKRTGERTAQARSSTRFTAETARDAAQKSVEARREKAQRKSEAAQLDQLTIRQRGAHELNARKARIPIVLDALLVKAEKGDVPAAREYRAWHDQMLGRPEGASVSEGDVDTPYEDMTPGERAVVRARVVREIARLEADDASNDAASDEVA